MSRVSPIGWWGLISAAAMLIGAFGPWAKAVFITVSGTDGSNDGWLVVVAAVVGGLLSLGVGMNGSRGLATLALLAAIGAAAVTIYDRDQLTSRAQDAELQGLVQIGWGLNLAMIASVSLGLAALGGVLGLWRSPSDSHTEAESSSARG